MKKLKLTDIAPYSGKRVQPFDGVKRYMSTGDLKGDNLSFEDVTYQSKPSRANIAVSEGDILFAKMMNTNKALQIDKEHDGIIVSTGFSVHRPIKNVLNGDYFLQFLKHEEFQRQKNKLCTGAIQSAISNTGIEKILVPIPEHNDQIHISNILSKAENLVIQRKESIRLLDEFLKSTFLDMFYSNPETEKWDEVKFEELANKKKGSMRTGPFGSSLLHGEFTETGDVKVLGIDNVVTNRFDWKRSRCITNEKYQELKRYRVFPNDVLISIMATLGRTAVVPKDIPFCINSKHLAAITLDKEIANPYFVAYAFHSHPLIVRQMTNSVKGAIMDGLNLTIIRRIKLKLPPIELQNKFGDMFEKTEALKAQYQNSLQQLENLYGSLSQKAFKEELTIKAKEQNVVIQIKQEAKIEQSELTKQQAFLRKLMLASHVIYELCEESTFGHTKLMKLLYLCEQAGGMTLQTNYKKFAAGPFDSKLIKSVDKEYTKNKWFTIEKKSFTIGGQQREATVYKKTEKSLSYKKHFENYFASEADTINRLIELFRKEKTQTAEIVATLYFAWKELTAAKTIISDNALIDGFYKFHPEKKKFTPEQIMTGYKYMQTNELYPHL